MFTALSTLGGSRDSQYELEVSGSWTQVRSTARRVTGLRHTTMLPAAEGAPTFLKQFTAWRYVSAVFAVACVCLSVCLCVTGQVGVLSRPYKLQGMCDFRLKCKHTTLVIRAKFHEVWEVSNSKSDLQKFKSFKGIDSGVIRPATHDFLSVLHCN